jgi:hypothetical protein
MLNLEDMLEPHEIRKLSFMTIAAKKGEGASEEEISKVLEWAHKTRAMNTVLDLVLMGNTYIEYDKDIDDIRFHAVPPEEILKLRPTMEKLEEE